MMSHLDPHINQCALEVYGIIHLSNLANQLPNAFIDAKKMTKSHIQVFKYLAWIDVPIEQLANESKTYLRHGRPIDLMM